MGSIGKVLVLGGTRSGKSAFAERLLRDRESVCYVATAGAPQDAHFAERIRAHQLRRPSTWTTLEVEHLTQLPTQLRTIGSPVLLDSIGSISARLLEESDQGFPKATETGLPALIEEICAALASQTAPTVIVSEEVGLTIHPSTSLGRAFVDLHGSINQRLAELCDDVYLVVAGRPLRLDASLPGSTC